uniref:titin homolog isoform X2 n=1 Tax=Erigeron canadensis TaxID=72917 RepID=UPI001CB98A8F|nr:titin homolog isoform X2 [Erigeron canadensis]
MDPTTTVTPPPQNNPDTPPDIISNNDDGSSINNNSQSNTSSGGCQNMNNLKSLALKLAAGMLPAHQSLLQRHLDDIFPDELIVPDHPPYSDMILTALWELKAEGGATGTSEEAISEFIKKEYHELPWAHATILNHHLKDLHMKGRITMKQNRFYLCPSSVTKPTPAPTLCSSPMSSSYSSSPTSVYSSPTSSSTSFSCGPSYERPKSKRRRQRRKNPVGRGGKTVQVRGRGRGRGRTPKKMQVGQDKEEEEKETGFLVEGRTKVIIGQNVCGKRNEDVKYKGESVGVRRSGRRKHDVCNEKSLPCEQAKKGTKEQGQKRKHYNVVWIGRRVRKLTEFERDLLEDESGDEVTGIEDNAAREKDVEMIGSDTEIVEQYEQKEAKTAINVKQTWPIKNQKSDIIKKQNDMSGEQVESQRQSKDETHKRFHVQGQQQNESTEQDQLLNQEVQTADGQDSVTMQCEERLIVAGVGNLNNDTVTEPIHLEEQHENGYKLEENQEVQTIFEQDVQMMQCEAQANIAGVGNLNIDTVTKQIRPEERHKKDNSLEKENQEDQSLVEQDVVMMQCEAQIIGAGEGNLNDDTVTEEIQADERNKKVNKPEEENQKDQTLVEQNAVMMQCEAHAVVAGVGNLNDDTAREEIRLNECRKKGNKLEEENQENETLVEQDVLMMQSEAQAIVADVGNLNDDTITEQIRPEERCKKGNNLEEANQDQSPVEQDVVMMQCEAQTIGAGAGNLNDDTAAEEIRLDERHKKGNKLEEENQEDQTLVEQDAVMMQCEAHAIVAGVGKLNDDTVKEEIQPEEQHRNGNKVEKEIIEQDVVMMKCEVPSIVGVEKQHDDTVKEQIWSEEPNKGNKSEELNHSREQCTERNRGPLRSCGQDRLQNEEAKSAEERTQQGERTEGNQTENVPVTGTEVQQDQEMHQSETQARQTCVTENVSEEQQLASEKHLQPQDQCTEENKSQQHEQQGNVVGQVQLQGEVKVAEDELQQEQPHNVEEKDNGPVHDVSTGQQDFVITQTGSEVEGDSEECKTSEVHQDQIGMQETLASDLRPQHEGLDNAVLQEEYKQRLPLKKRLRSSCTYEETIPNTQNQLDLVTPPVRRSQRNHKTVPEAVGKTEGPDHSKEQLQQSGGSRPSTRNSKIAEAEQLSNSRKTRSRGL